MNLDKIREESNSMAYLKFQNSKSLVKCDVIPQGQNVVTLKFDSSVVVNTSGFSLYLDEKGEYDISGDSYKGFTTIYRNDDATAEYNGYQLSNDGSVYTEVTEDEVTEPAHEYTDEEIAAMEKSQKISAINSQINALKAQLQETDYIFTKCYELSLIGETSDEYDFAQLHEERQEIRDRINSLEQQIVDLAEEDE